MSKIVLLVMDFQEDILSLHEQGGSRAALDQANKAIATARSAAVPVVFVRVAYRAGFTDASDRNKRVSLMKQKGILLEASPGAKLSAQLDVRDHDPVVTKRRVSALAHTDLRSILTTAQCDTLVLCGLSTSGVVLSTVRQAVDDDFRVAVLSDACADADAEAHDILMRKIFPSQADVLPVAGFAEYVANAAM